MHLEEFLAEIDRLGHDADAAFRAAGDVAALETARIEFLGMKSGRLKTVQKALGAVEKAEKPQAGQRFNQVKQQIDAALESARIRLESGVTAAATGPCVDPTVPGIRPRLGTSSPAHPDH